MFRGRACPFNSDFASQQFCPKSSKATQTAETKIIYFDSEITKKKYD